MISKFLFAIVFVFLSNVNAPSVFCDVPVGHFDADIHDRRDDPKKLKIMQFNADWITMSGEDNWYMKGKFTASQAITHLEKVAQIIAGAEPDIAVLEEVAGCRPLEKVRTSLGSTSLADKYKSYVMANFDNNKQHVGILTKLDPVDIDVAHEKSRLKATYFEFPVKELGDSLKLYGIHLISTDDQARNKQANELKSWIKLHKNNKDPYVIVMGDFNDYDAYNVKKRYLYVGKNIHKIKQTKPYFMTDQSGLYETKSDAVETMRQSRLPFMINAMYFAPKEERKTNAAKTPHAIDHIMLTEELANLVETVEMKTDIIDGQPGSPEQHGYILMTLDLNRYYSVVGGQREIVYDVDNKKLQSMSLVDIDTNYIVPVLSTIDKEITKDISKLRKLETQESLAQFYNTLRVEREEELIVLMRQKQGLLDPCQNELIILKKILKILDANNWKTVEEKDKATFIEKSKFYRIWKGFVKKRLTKQKIKKKKFTPAKYEKIFSEFPPTDAEIQKSMKICKDLIEEKETDLSKIPKSLQYKEIATDIQKANTKYETATQMIKQHTLNKKQLLKLFEEDELAIKKRISDNSKLLKNLKKSQKKYSEAPPIPLLFAKTNKYGSYLDIDKFDNVDVWNGDNTEMDLLIMLFLTFGTLFCICLCAMLGVVIGYLVSQIFKK